MLADAWLFLLSLRAAQCARSINYNKRGKRSYVARLSLTLTEPLYFTHYSCFTLFTCPYHRTPYQKKGILPRSRTKACISPAALPGRQKPYPHRVRSRSSNVKPTHRLAAKPCCWILGLKFEVMIGWK